MGMSALCDTGDNPSFCPTRRRAWHAGQASVFQPKPFVHHATLPRFIHEQAPRRESARYRCSPTANSLEYCWRSHYILESSCRASCCDSRMLAIVSRSIAISRSFAANVVLAAVFVEPLLLPLSWTVAREMSATHAHPHSCMHVVISLRHNKSTRHNQPITRHTNARIIIPRSNDD
jgi:hypothetical protein